MRRQNILRILAVLAAGGAIAPAPAAADERIAAGWSHTCVRQGDGRVLCVGHNSFGELGNSTYINSETPVVVRNLDNALAVAGGYHRSCAVTRDGATWCWGSNSYGALGDGTASPRTRPVRFWAREDDGSGRPLSGSTAVATAWMHTCALAAARVWCAGSNVYGQLGSGTSDGSIHPLALPVALTGVTALALGSTHSCAVREDGTVWCWGGNGVGQVGSSTATCGRDPCAPTPTRVDGVADVTAVSAGGGHTCALRRDGKVLCWGTLSDLPTAQPSPPVTVLDGATGVTSGSAFSCATRIDGTAACWGDNTEGQLGRGTFSGYHEPPAPVLIPTTVRGISAGSWHACARTEDHAVWCWGDGSQGQLGYEPQAFWQRSIPTKTSMRAE